MKKSVIAILLSVIVAFSYMPFCSYADAAPASGSSATPDMSKFYVHNFYSEGISYKSFKLCWDPVAGADGYKVYRVETIPGNNTKQEIIERWSSLVATIKDSKKCSYTITSRKLEFYYVRPYYNAGDTIVEGNFYVITEGNPIDLTKTEYANDNKTPIIDHIKIHSTEFYRYIELEASYDGTGSPVQYAPKLYSELGGSTSYKNAPEVFNGTTYVKASVDNRGKYYWISAVTFLDKGGNCCYYCLDDSVKIYALRSEFPTEFSGALSNPNVLSALKTMDDGRAVVLTIDEASKGILKKEYLDAIRGTDKTIVVKGRSGSTWQWIFYGKQITGQTKDLDLNVKVTKVDGSIYGNSGSVLKLDFADNGVLPGKVNFRVNASMTDVWGESDNLYVYHLSGKTIKPEPSNCVVFNASSSKFWAYIDLTHNSTFLLSNKKLNKTVKPKAIKPKVTLSSKSMTWNGKNRVPTVSVYDGSKKLVKGTDYTLSMASTRKSVGQWKIKVTLKGNYSGSKTVSFKIIPKKTSISTVKAGSKKLTVKWKKQSAKMSRSRITGYQVQVATNKSFTANKKSCKVKGYTKVSKTFKNLKGGRKYYVRVRTYKVVNGKTYYSKWSTVKSKTTKK